MFSDAHMNGKFMCKMEAVMYIGLRMLQHFGLNFISFVQYTHIYKNNTVQMVYNTSIIQMGSRKKSEDLF